MTIPETVLIAIITSAGVVLAAAVTVLPALVKLYVERKVAALEARVADLESGRKRDGKMIERLVLLLRGLLNALRRHDPGEVDKVRRENPDLNL